VQCLPPQRCASHRLLVQKQNERLPSAELTKKSGEDSILKVTYAVFLFHWPEIVLVMCIAAYWAAGYYATFIWMAYYTSDLMPGGGMEHHHPWIINITMMIVLVTCLPVGGIIGDIVTTRCRSSPPPSLILPCLIPSCASLS
jgi:hypothetical protein